MAGNNMNAVCCCFCGEALDRDDAVEMVVSLKVMGQERQHLFAHKVCLTRAVHRSVPLHPDFLE